MKSLTLSPATKASPMGFGEADYQLFASKAQVRYGVRLQDYKSDQMMRRLATVARRLGAGSFLEYMQKMDRDAVLLKSFLDEVTINVTELLRNPALFEQFRKEILPDLKKQNRTGSLAVWSAGCSYGAEAYSMAMVLREFDKVAPFRIVGTDIDPSIIARANTPSFTEADMRNVSEERRKANFNEVVEGHFSPMLALKRQVSFSKHDLLADPYPRATYDVICCRNVVIYFTDEAKERIYKGFYSALRPGGVLFVGGSERLSNHAKLGFESVCPFFYRRPLGS